MKISIWSIHFTASRLFLNNTPNKGNSWIETWLELNLASNRPMHNMWRGVDTSKNIGFAVKVNNLRKKLFCRSLGFPKFFRSLCCSTEMISLITISSSIFALILCWRLRVCLERQTGQFRQKNWLFDILVWNKHCWQTLDFLKSHGGWNFDTQIVTHWQIYGKTPCSCSFLRHDGKFTYLANWLKL